MIDDSTKSLTIHSSNNIVAIGKTKKLISITNSILSKVEKNKEEWVIKVLEIADINGVPDLQWRNRTSDHRKGYWSGFPRQKEQIFELSSFFTTGSQQELGMYLFKQCCQNICQNNINVGECFERNVSFETYISPNTKQHRLSTFTNNKPVLIWRTCAEGDDKELLKNSFGMIRQCMRETFGTDIQIESVGCNKELKENDV